MFIWPSSRPLTPFATSAARSGVKTLGVFVKWTRSNVAPASLARSSTAGELGDLEAGLEVWWVRYRGVHRGPSPNPSFHPIPALKKSPFCLPFSSPPSSLSGRPWEIEPPCACNRFNEGMFNQHVLRLWLPESAEEPRSDERPLAARRDGCWGQMSAAGKDSRTRLSPRGRRHAYGAVLPTSSSSTA